MPPVEPSGVLIARQPILDAQKRIHGYELLHHAPPWMATDPEESTQHVLNCLVNHFSPAVLAGGKSIFVNLTSKAVQEGAYAQLPPENTIIELQTPREAAGSELIEACQAMRVKGYKLSLDDFDPDLPSAAGLAPLADYLKFDVGSTIDTALLSKMKAMHDGNRPIIAQGVSREEQFTAARAAGIDLFQGFFFFKPQLLEKRDIPSIKMNYIRFIEAVSRPELKLDELEKVIRQDAAISVALLRLINSAAFGIRNEVKSIKQALALLGEIKVRRWAASLAAKELGAGKPVEIIGVTLTRAFFCESLGKLFRHENQLLDLFMTGIVSGLPSMLDVPLLKLLDELSITQSIRDALASKPTPMGNIFSLAMAHETGAFAGLDKLAGAYSDATRVARAITPQVDSTSAAA